MRGVSSYVPSRDSLPRERNLKDAATGCGCGLAEDRNLPDYGLMTREEKRRLAEHIRKTEDRPVSRCWRVSWKWGAKGR